MEEIIAKEKFVNRLIIASLSISFVAFLFVILIFIKQPNLQPIDMNRWKKEKKYGFYYQNDIIYYNHLIDVTKATLSIYYPNNLLTCRDEYKFYKCAKKSSETEKIAMILNSGDYIPKETINKYMKLNYIVVNPNFHEPYEYYDIILTITEIKASIKYILSNFKDSQLFVIGNEIYGEICNVLAVSQNHEKYKDLLKKLEPENENEKIDGIISILPKGGFDIQNSAFEWLMKDKRKSLEEDSSLKKIHENLAMHYEKYLNEIFNVTDFNCPQNNTINNENNLISKYRSCLNKIYNITENNSYYYKFPLIDGIYFSENRENKLFGNYYKKTCQHFDYDLNDFANRCINSTKQNFSVKNNYGKNLNISLRVYMSSPMFYVNDYLSKKNEHKPQNWIIYSDPNFLNYSYSYYFPTEFNLYLKLFNKTNLKFTLINETKYIINFYKESLKILNSI